MKLEWKEEYSVKVKELDEQHKKLFGFINDLNDAVHAENTKKELYEMIDDLNNYAKFHLATEERYFEQFDYVDRQEHEKRHNDYIVEVLNFEEKVHKLNGHDATKVAFEMLDFLEDWWVNHILHEDKGYTETFNNNGLK